MLYRSNDEAMIEQLQKDPELTLELLKIAIEEDTPEELKGIMRLINAAGYDVSVTPKPAPRKRAKAIKAKPTPIKRAKPGAAKKTARRPAARSRTRSTATAAATA